VTIPTVHEEGRSLGTLQRAGAVTAVGAARLLLLLPPSRLARVLRLLRRGAGPATTGQALAARQAAVAVSARCAGLGCLQRSVAAALMCRAQGTWADWCTGFRTRPFAAHAWLEVDGVPVGEPEGLAVFQSVITVRWEPAPDPAGEVAR
jgi:hypothetical protein